MHVKDRFENTIKEFDDVNSHDPHLEMVEGEKIPKELLYSKRMTEMLNHYRPNASETLQLAARCQHIKRWAIPREEYPMDKKGYLLWRTTLKKYHGELAASIMTRNGYGHEEIQKVDDLLNKRKLKSDEETQALEDVICLVFLQYYFDEFITKHDEAKLVEIVQKTWNKMSENGREAALQLAHSVTALAIVNKALS